MSSEQLSHYAGCDEAEKEKNSVRKLYCPWYPKVFYILYKEEIIRGNKDTHQIMAAAKGETRSSLINRITAAARARRR